MYVWIFSPEGHGPDDCRPAMVFFFGGGWRSGNPIQFKKHCEYLAIRGMVAITADYRVSSRHGVKAYQCVEDAKSAIRWIRRHAERLGIDPNRIVAGGGSAGGHLAAATATLPMYDDLNDDMSVSARPDALVLFNPLVALSSIPGEDELSDKRITDLNERMGIELFHNKMKAQGNLCLLVGYDGADHGFFNYGRDDNAYYIDTVNKMDAFLVSLGYLKGARNTIYCE